MDALRGLLDEGVHPSSMQPAKGVHVTIPWSLLRNDVAMVLPVPGDARSVFVIPWDEHTYVGTTDTAYAGALDAPHCTANDVEYLLGAVRAATTVPISADDVVGSWAGLRPLLRGTSRTRTADLSRRHAVRVAPSGVVTVTGGKLTTYRRMAADAVDAAQALLPGRAEPSATKTLRLAGSEGVPTPTAALTSPRTHRPRTRSEHLAGRYGSEARAVEALARSTPGGDEPLVSGLPYLKAEAVYAVREEMASCLDDVLSRRTRALLLDREATAAAAPIVAELLEAELGWDDARTRAEIDTFATIVAAERC